MTPTVSTTHDRLGRAKSVSAGTNSLGRFWASNGTQISEAWTAGVLAGHHLTNTFDAYLRRSTLTPKNGGTTLGSVLTYTYDGAGRLQKVDDGSYSATYAYLANSPLWGTLEFKNGATTRATTTRQFDTLNRLQSITTAPTGSGAQPVSSGYAYNRANQRTRRAEADASYWVYQYDDLGQVISGKKFWSDGTPVAGQQFEYAYDDIGNWKSAKEGGNENGLALRSASYTANTLNQYTSRTNSPSIDVLGLGTPSATLTINGTSPYRRGDYFRNELAITNASGPLATPVTVLATSGATTNTSTGFVLSPPASQTLAYDLDGNLTNDLVWSYTWDGESRLLSVETLSTVTNTARARVTCDYDAAGRRVRQSVATNWTGSAYSATNTTLYLYDGWACVAELNAAGTFQRQYAWGLDLSGTPTGAGGVGGLLWMRPSGGAAHFAAFDGNGNVAALVDGSTGTVSARYDYDPFGQTLRLTGTGTIAKDNPFRFSTKRADPTTGLVLYEYRAYSPTLGRWPNRDPIGEKGGVNSYLAAWNDAVSGFDILGLYGSWLENFTEEHEGFRSNAYTDTKGYRTIGIGFNLDDSTIQNLLRERGHDVDDLERRKSSLTRDAARGIMKTLLTQAEADALRYLGDDCAKHLTETAKDVLTAMAYQLGLTRLRAFRQLRNCLCQYSACLKPGNEPDYECAANAMLDSLWARSDSPSRAKHLAALMLYPWPAE